MTRSLKESTAVMQGRGAIKVFHSLVAWEGFCLKIHVGVLWRGDQRQKGWSEAA